MDINKQLFNYILSQDWANFKKLITETGEIDLNIRDESSNYLIQYIILYNKVDLFDILIEKKCKIDIIDNDGKIMLYYVIKYNYYDLLVKMLNTTYIGLSLINFKDKNKIYPIHYAVMFNNENMIKLLLEKENNINIKDNNGFTPLMYALKNKNYSIIKMIIENPGINLNLTNNIGECALHIACSYNQDSVVELLLKYSNIDINIQDLQNKFSSLMYSVVLNNFNITNMLLENPNINMLLQDSLGNTVLHHAILEKSNEDIIKLLDEKLNTVSSNIYNLTNVNGNTILHLLLEKNVQISLKKYIENTNLNIQNSQGNTIWHLFGKRWMNYIPELEQKKNNVFIKNKRNEISFDKYKDSDKFMEMLVKSYYNYLKLKKREWKNDWENICKNNDLVKKIDFKDSTPEKNCYEKIKKHITEYNVSVPYKKISYCIQLDNNSITEFVSYTGTSLDILIGVLYLKEFENVYTSLTKKFIINEDLNEYYKVLGITKEIKGEYMNFEITWLYQKLFFPTNLPSIINSFKESKKRFFIIPLGIHQDNGAHANILLYDSELNELERFEPVGGGYPMDFNYNPELLDYYLETYFKEHFNNCKYFKPISYEFLIGFQTMEVVDINKKIGDPNGFCGAWSLWWVYMRIKNSTISRKKLFIQLVKNIRKNNLSFKNIIRSFSKIITDMRDSLLKKVSLDINKWLNDDFDYDVFDRFNSIIEKLI